MMATRFLVLGCIVLDAASPSTVLAKPEHAPARLVAAQLAAPTPPAIAIRGNSGILRQDLFDRANPNNARTDWPAPPAQPGQH